MLVLFAIILCLLTSLRATELFQSFALNKQGCIDFPGLRHLAIASVFAILPSIACPFFYSAGNHSIHVTVVLLVVAVNSRTDIGVSLAKWHYWDVYPSFAFVWRSILSNFQQGKSSLQ
jgi:hypothetical protein